MNGPSAAGRQGESNDALTIREAIGYLPTHYPYPSGKLLHEPVRNALDALTADLARCREPLEWLVSLDDPEDVLAREERRSVTLEQIIRRAERALAGVPADTTRTEQT